MPAEIAPHQWAETFAQAVAGRGRFRGATDEEAAAWLYGIARRQLAGYYRNESAHIGAQPRNEREDVQLSSASTDSPNSRT